MGEETPYRRGEGNYGGEKEGGEGGGEGGVGSGGLSKGGGEEGEVEVRVRGREEGVGATRRWAVSVMVWW